MSGSVFVDTNVLVYAVDTSEGDKHRRTRQWLLELWRTRQGCLSAQVLSEFYDVVTRKLQPGLPRDDARRYAASFRAWEPLPVDLELIRSAWAIQDEVGLSWWDGLIVAAAAAAHAPYLLTEDMSHGQQIGSVQIISPFITLPEEVLS
jgi:predicted nucleic acid-binding protein